MKPIKRQHMVATLFPASMLEIVRQQSPFQANGCEGEILLLTGPLSAQSRCVRLIAEEFALSGKTVRVVRTLRNASPRNGQ